MKLKNEEKNMSNEKTKVIDVTPKEQGVAIRDSYIPQFPTERQIEEYDRFLENYDKFVGKRLKSDTDFGIIPGVQKPSLFKPGAEKLEKLFFLTHEKVCVKEVDEPAYVEYVYKTTIYSKDGRVKATCEGSANSKENKYRYYTKFYNEASEEEKNTGETITKTSRNGKPYQIVRIEKKDFYDVKNTIRKMAQKRSYVGAILEATNSSGRFTHDVEDMAEFSREETTPETPQKPNLAPSKPEVVKMTQSSEETLKKGIFQLLTKLKGGKPKTAGEAIRWTHELVDLELKQENFLEVLRRLQVLTKESKEQNA